MGHGSAVFKNDLLTGLKPGIPGGETPPSTAGETPAATEGRESPCAWFSGAGFVSPRPPGV